MRMSTSRNIQSSWFHQLCHIDVFLSSTDNMRWVLHKLHRADQARQEARHRYAMEHIVNFKINKKKTLFGLRISSTTMGWGLCFKWTQGFPAEHCIVTRWSMLFTSHVRVVAGCCISFQLRHHIVSVRKSQIVEHAMSGTANDLATDPQRGLLHIVGHAKWSTERERAGKFGNVSASASHSKPRVSYTSLGIVYLWVVDRFSHWSRILSGLCVVSVT